MHPSKSSYCANKRARNEAIYMRIFLATRTRCFINYITGNVIKRSIHTKYVFWSKVSPGRVIRKIDGELAKMTIINNHCLLAMVSPSHSVILQALWLTFHFSYPGPVNYQLILLATGIHFTWCRVGALFAAEASVDKAAGASISFCPSSTLSKRCLSMI